MDPPKYWTHIPADLRKSAIFHFFVFFSFDISVVHPIFRKKKIWDKNFSTKNVSKNHEKLFGEQHNIKELSHKKNFGCAHNRHKKIQFFRFFTFCTGKIGYFEIGKNVGVCNSCQNGGISFWYLVRYKWDCIFRNLLIKRLAF